MVLFERKRCLHSSRNKSLQFKFRQSSASLSYCVYISGIKLYFGATIKISSNAKPTMFFFFQMPVPRNSMQLDYSRWQQNLIGVLQVDIAYHKQIEIGIFANRILNNFNIISMVL